MSKLLVTHARPHLDDVAAIWILKKFHPDFSDAQIQFLVRPVGGQFEIPEGATAIGIGRAEFDEHKGDLADCAATLVWKWLKQQSSVAIMPETVTAVDRLIAWVLKDDLGQLNSVDWHEWSASAAFANYDGVVPDDDHQVYTFGVQLLESLLVGFRDQVALDRDWAERIEFDTKWGKAIALESEVHGSSARAYRQGAVLVVEIDRDKGFRQFRAEANSSVDLSDIYEKVRTREPQASWFLHHSHRLLLCGSSSATEFVPSRLTLQEMIALVQK